jgi:ketosteroid isomerase-like protein
MTDEEAIQQVLNLYTEGSGKADWDQVLGTFLTDGIWEVPGVGTFTGRDEIQPVMEGFIAQMDYFVQLNTPAIIAVDGDTATARSVIRECGKFKGRHEALEVLGFYSDELVRTSEGWKFARRTWKAAGMHRFALLPDPALG